MCHNSNAHAAPSCMGVALLHIPCGVLLYRSTHTRPDLAFAVGALSGHVAQPTDQQFLAAKRVLQYLRGTYKHGLFFAAGATANAQGMLLYADADLAGDNQKRKSTTGMVLVMYRTPVMWMSKLLSVTAMSTAEAEYIACAMAAKEGLWA
jgi:hypothetical protein